MLGQVNLRALIIFVAGGCACFSPATGRADLIPEIAARAQRAVIEVDALDARGNLLGRGTAFFISADGKVATSFHVIQGAARIVGLGDTGAEYRFERVVNLPAGIDLAILKFSAVNTPHLALGSSRTAVEGQRILVIGNPIGLHETISDGLIAAPWANHSQLQITAPVWPESSGSPVLDEAGNVIGVAVSRVASGQDLNLVIPVEQVIAALNAPPSQQSSHAPPDDGEVYAGEARRDLPDAVSPDVTAKITSPDEEWRSQVERFISDFIASSNSPYNCCAADYFADTVNYNGSLATVQAIARESDAFERKWPIRTYQMLGSPLLTREEKPCVAYRAKLQVVFRVANRTEVEKGKVAYDLIIEDDGKQLFITDYRKEVLRRSVDLVR
jgi:hypothetical protein